MKVRMETEINFDELMNVVTEMWDSIRDWELKKDWSTYSAKHSCSFDNWKRLQIDANAEQSARHDVFWSVASVCGFDCDRLEKAIRYANKWYEKTKWQRCMPEEMEKNLVEYIVKGDKKKLIRWHDAHFNVLWRKGIRGKDLWEF